MPQRTMAPSGDLGEYYLSYGIGQQMLRQADQPERAAATDGDDQAVFTPNYDDLWQRSPSSEAPTGVGDDDYDVYGDEYDDNYDDDFDGDFDDDYDYDYDVAVDGAGYDHGVAGDENEEYGLSYRQGETDGLDPVSLRPTFGVTVDEMLRSFDRLPRSWMSRLAPSVLRVGLGLVFLWFGTLKFVPGVSPAEGLVRSTFSELFDLIGLGLSPTIALYLLAMFEVTIGTGLIVDAYRPALVWLLLAHLAGTMLPVLLLPELVWTQFPLGLTLEGQYIVKNIILVGAAMAIGGSIDQSSGRAADDRPYQELPAVDLIDAERHDS